MLPSTLATSHPKIVWLRFALVLAVIAVLGLASFSQSASTAAAGPCDSPTVITGGGSFAVSTAGTCFKYVNTSFRWGAQFTVMNPSDSTVSNTVQWYGGLNENTTSCAVNSRTLSGNGAQINNFTVSKDASGTMFVTVTGNKANTVSISVQNWQNGTGCSATPTPVGTTGPTNTPTRINTPGGPTNTPTRTNTATNTPTRTNTPTNTPVGPTNTPTRTNTPTNTPVGPTNTPTRTNTPTNTPVGPTNTPTRTPTVGNNGGHLSNPFPGAKWYINPDWAAEVNASSVSAAAKSVVSQQNTAVWLDSMATLNGTNGSRGLIGHLDAAVAQGANLILIVVYDLPNRDCSALASNGELLISNNGAAIYKSQYIDVIANDITSKPAYANLRIVAIVEPDSLPNLITNTGIAKCQQATGTGGYVENITYAINKLHPLSNVYLYLDIGHAGWLGWSNNFNPAITLYSNLIKGTNAGVTSIDGFIDNTANNQVIQEPYMTANQQISGQPVRSAFFFSWNDYIEEDTYDAAWKAAIQAQNIPASSTNMLIDTSRNGWGGCGGGPNVSQQCRPTGPSTSTVLETFVNQSRIDRRPAKGDWCNQNGAGLGERPTANPGNSVYQAYVWIKPPGESDGSSSLIPPGPDNPDGKGFDQMCDPNYSGNSLNQNQNTNALPNAPVSGRWFEAQFEQLVQNAFPPLQ